MSHPGQTRPVVRVTVIGRLQNRKEFLHVRGGARCNTPSLLLQARAREDARQNGENVARFGFTATKALGGAVIRNRARRRLKEAVRLVAPAHATKGYDYVLIARAGTLQRPFTALTEDLTRALTKVHEPAAAKTR